MSGQEKPKGKFGSLDEALSQITNFPRQQHAIPLSENHGRTLAGKDLFCSASGSWIEPK